MAIEIPGMLPWSRVVTGGDYEPTTSRAIVSLGEVETTGDAADALRDGCFGISPPVGWR